MKVNEKNFVRLTQVITRFGKEERIVEKVYPHNKDFMIYKLRLQIKDVPGGFWADLSQKNEAVLEDRFGGKIRFQITPIDGDSTDEESAGA